jgi:hypothetical protein
MKTNCVTATVKRSLAISALALGLLVQPAGAVILLGSGDPAYNTTPPTGALADSGWQYQGSWGDFLGTPIAPQYFIAAHHVGGSVGQTFTFQGRAYTTTAYWDNPNSDFRIWKVDGTFSSYAPFYPLTDEDGKLMVVIGRGTQRGSEVVVTCVQTNYTTNTATLKHPGTSKKTKVLSTIKKLAQREWPEARFEGSTMTVNLNSVGVSKKLAQQEFPGATFHGNTMTIDLMSLGVCEKLTQREFPDATFHGNTTAVVSATVTTNLVSKGWKADASDGVMRWGQSQVIAGGCYIVGSFDKNGGANQAYLSGGDSSGAVFIQDNGVWKLAGINYGVDGPFGVTPADAFYGAIFDVSGLYVGGAFVPNDGQIYPACFYATRISYRLTWIQSIINQ